MSTGIDKFAQTHDRGGQVKGGDRRRFFRITDQVVVKYRVISAAQEDPGSTDVLYSRHGGSKHLRGNQDLILNRIERQFPDVARYLQYLESRVNEMYRLLLLQEIEMGDSSIKEASLSGGGLAFYAAEDIKPGAYLQLKLLLMSSCVAVLCRGTVVRSERRSMYLPTHPYRIAVEFDAIDEGDRDILIKHILKRQAAKLRHEKPT